MNVHANRVGRMRHPLDRADCRLCRATRSKTCRNTPKTLSPKYFYDAAGSELFEQITLLPEYYPTRTELGILRDRGSEIASIIPKDAALVEFGAGATTKVRLLLERCEFGAYVPVDISGDFLKRAGRAPAQGFSRRSPSIRWRPISPQPFELPRGSRAACRRSASFRARPSAISSRTKRAPSCAAPRDILGEGAHDDHRRRSREGRARAARRL